MLAVRFRSLLLLLVFALSLAVMPGYSQTGRPVATSVRSITIESEPDATVWLDGVRYGKTTKTGTLEIGTVASGAHTMRVSAAGFKEKTEPLTAAQKGT